MAADDGEQMVRIPVHVLEEFSCNILEAVGVPRDDAAICAGVLVDADVTGRYTHGVTRLPLYVERIRRGLINPRATVRVEAGRFAAVAVVDGDNGLGPVVAWRAMEHVLALSEQFGTAAVGVRHSNHAGAMSPYCTAAARRGYILMALTNSPPGIVPWGGRRPYLGTNPLAFGIPRAGGRAPVIVDLATSVVARGHIIEKARRHEPIPPDWAIDENGQPTTDADAALRGAVLPMAGAKGYALALVVEILSGVLSGAGFGPHVANPYQDFSQPSNVGHFFWALHPSGFGAGDSEAGGFAARLETLLTEILQVPPAPGQSVRLPGDRAEQARAFQLEHGIPLDDKLVNDLNALAVQCHAPTLPI